MRLRRALHGLACCVGLMMAGMPAALAQVTVTDVTGRQVEIPAPAKRIILEAPAYYPALSLVSRNAAELVVGVGGSESRGVSEPERDLADKPRLGTISTQTFSAEKALALEPDLLIATFDKPGQPSPIAAAFERAGIPIIHVDFFVDPAANTVPSIEAIGLAIGEQERAAAFADFHRSRIAAITSRIDAAGPTPPALMVLRRSLDGTCCWSFAGGFISGFFDQLRVDNIAEGKLPGPMGQLSLEAVIESDPDVLVATDLSLGPDSILAEGRDRAQSASALEALGDQPGLRETAAVGERRVHAISINLMRSPLNVLAVELFAKWSHPELFADLDPQATLDEINARFLATPLAGPFWVSLDAVADGAGAARP